MPGLITSKSIAAVEWVMRTAPCRRVSCWLLPVARAHASNLTIIPTFEASITGDINAAAIENVINSAIAIYEADFSNPINVAIDFQEMSSGLGGSSTSLFQISYPTFLAEYKVNASKDPVAQTALADGVVPNGAVNPVNGASNVWIKTANYKALGFPCSFCPTFDGTISLNTGITFPGSPGSSGAYSLMAVVEHEMDEVPWPGSDLGSGLPTALPMPEDLFRFDALGNRTFTTSSGALAYFSVDGKTDLAQFDNQNDGGDFADWQSNPRAPGVQPKVQDAFATPGATPQLGVELIALQAVECDAIAPEPASLSLLAVSLPLFGWMAWRRVRSRRASA